MLPRSVRITTSVLLAGLVHGAAPDTWFRQATSHAEIYTLAGDANAAGKKSRDALIALENIRTVLQDATHAEWNQVIPVRVISFPSEKQFKPYAPIPGAVSFSATTQSRDYLVMMESDPDHFTVALHQYAHLVLVRAGLKLPTWASEGLAELLTTIKPSGSDAAVGGAIRDHIEELKSVKWLDLGTLTAVTEKSPAWNEGNRAGQFYAESWALMHMFYLSQSYRANFGKMLALLNEGKPAQETWQTAFGRTEAQVYSDLQAYVKQNLLVASIVPVKRENAPADASPTAVSELETGVMLGDLFAAMNHKQQALAAYEKLAQQFPRASAVYESMGYLAWQNDDPASAQKYFEQALPGTTNPQMCYHLAMLYHDSGQGGDKLVATLSKAVALKPDFTDARFQLGITEYNRGNYEAAISALKPIDHIQPEHAAPFYLALSFAYFQIGDLPMARKTLEAGRLWIKTDSDKRRAAELEQYLGGK